MFNIVLKTIRCQHICNGIHLSHSISIYNRRRTPLDSLFRRLNCKQMTCADIMTATVSWNILRKVCELVLTVKTHSLHAASSNWRAEYICASDQPVVFLYWDDTLIYRLYFNWRWSTDPVVSSSMKELFSFNIAAQEEACVEAYSWIRG